MTSRMTHLHCPNCGKKYKAEPGISYCSCGSPIFAQYDIKAVSEDIANNDFPGRENSMWRYASLLPVDSRRAVTLGEGWTPLLSSKRIHEYMGLESVYIKQESQNPTLSFKDRGLSAAISKHTQLRSNHFVIPSAGNAAISMSAYAAAAGALATVYMPENTHESFFQACSQYGTEVIAVKGTIADCGTAVQKNEGVWTDISTTKEPFRVEGKKTLGFEICEQMNWSLPEVIICPTGGGTALLGIWKGIQELENVGLIDGTRPRMFAAQSDGCAPVVRAFKAGSKTIEPWEDSETKALGLRVPKPFADELILDILRESEGGAVAVDEKSIGKTRRLVAEDEGIDMCPEAAVAIAGAKKLVEQRNIDKNEDVVVLNTGSGVRYPS
ncbi:MAG: threonine synthase [Candidatus Thorarchaeota archaeon]